MSEIINPAWEDEVADRTDTSIKPRTQTFSRLGHDLEPHGFAGFLLNDSCSVPQRSAAD